MRVGSFPVRSVGALGRGGDLWISFKLEISMAGRIYGASLRPLLVRGR